MKQAGKLAIASGIVALGIAGVGLAQHVPANNVLRRALDIELGKQTPRAKEARLSSGALYAVLAASGALGARADAVGAQGAQFQPGNGGGTQGCSNSFQGNGSKNIRVNQDCSLRRQAESAIAINPPRPKPPAPCAKAA